MPFVLQKNLHDKLGELSRVIEAWHEFTSFRDGLPRAWSYVIRAVFLVGAIFLGCLVIELPWRDGSTSYDPEFFYWNVLLCGFILVLVYLVGQRTRASIAIFLVLCLMAGAALHFVVEFKSQVILPADVAALGTALAVSQGYTYEIDEQLWTCIGGVVLYCAALGILCPRVRMGWRGRAVTGVFAIAAVFLGAVAFTSVQVDESLDFEVNNWFTRSSYEEYGAPLSFLALAQDAHVPVPVGYSEERVKRILSQYSDDRIAWLNNENGEDEGEGGTDTSRYDQSPTVIVVMNESFADLTALAPADVTCFTPAACREVVAESLAGGTALSSVFGGGTCNSEFEFLTGTSMVFQNSGYYPYMFQDLSRPETLPRYFKSIGYHTVALHPNLPTNWQRDRVYPEMGFDEFLSNDSWGDVARVREEVRDAAVYDTILELINGSSNPQFLFAVTMANHSGYWWEVEPELQADIQEKPEGQLGVYADLIQLSDSDLQYFVNALQELDEPLVLCFFGDHQPSVANEPLAALTEQSFDDVRRSGDLAAMERYHEVPYFIWENDAQKANRIAGVEEEAEASHAGAGEAETSGEETGTSAGEAEGLVDEAAAMVDEAATPKVLRIASASTSICYLSAQLVELAGLPQTPFMQFTNVVRSHYPLFNTIGYFADGGWLSFSVEDATPEILNEYAIASYGLLTGEVA